LLSTFVKRTGDSNRSIAKIALPGLPAFRDFESTPAIAGLPALLRPGRWTAHRGFERNYGEGARRFEIRPCPSQDFNGAELLYFSAYQGFADRAEWELVDLPTRGVAVREREIVFHGNLEPGEGLVVRLRGIKPGAGAIRHWMSLEAAADGRPLADVFTTKDITRRGR